MVTLVAPPDVAVGVQGNASVVRERMITDEYYAIVDIDVEQVKNDLVRSIVINSAIMISPREEFEDWFDAVIGEIEDM
jgi:hypothetical protein